MERYAISVCGPNGAGKSTLSRTLFASLNFPIVDPDQFSSQGVSDIAAGKIAVRQINEYLANGISFIKESTLSSHFDVKTILRARELGYKNILIYLLLPSPEFAAQRVRRRVRGGGHDIPRKTIFRRFAKSLRNLERVKDIVDVCLILDNAGQGYREVEPGKVARLLEEIGARAL